MCDHQTRKNQSKRDAIIHAMIPDIYQRSPFAAESSRVVATCTCSSACSDHIRSRQRRGHREYPATTADSFAHVPGCVPVPPGSRGAVRWSRSGYGSVRLDDPSSVRRIIRLGCGPTASCRGRPPLKLPCSRAQTQQSARTALEFCACALCLRIAGQVSEAPR